MILLYLYNQLA